MFCSVLGMFPEGGVATCPLALPGGPLEEAAEEEAAAADRQNRLGHKLGHRGRVKVAEGECEDLHGGPPLGPLDEDTIQPKRTRI